MRLALFNYFIFLIFPYLDVNQQLKYVGMSFMKQANCDKILSKADDFRIDKDMICTDRTSNCDVSYQEHFFVSFAFLKLYTKLIGGAALKLVDHGGKSLIVAVASGHANCSSTQPRVFTRVEHHLDWIKKIMNGSDILRH